MNRINHWQSPLLPSAGRCHQPAAASSIEASCWQTRVARQNNDGRVTSETNLQLDNVQAAVAFVGCAHTSGAAGDECSYEGQRKVTSASSCQKTSDALDSVRDEYVSICTRNPSTNRLFWSAQALFRDQRCIGYVNL